MCFVCSGKDRRLFDALYLRVAGQGDGFVFCEDGLSLLRTMLFDSVPADVILLDYDLYKGFADFIFNLLDSKRLKIPLILIGGTDERGNALVSHWISENEFQYDVQDFHSMIPVFLKIAEALESDEVRLLLAQNGSAETCAGGVNETAPQTAKSAKRNMLADFRMENPCAPSVYKLLSFLYKNRRREISIEEIARHLNLSCGTEVARRNSVYSYISRLRKCLADTPMCAFELLRTRTGYYRLLMR